MARFQEFYGMRALGPHRPLLDALMRKVEASCEVCAGNGVRTISEDKYEPCERCMGFGGYFTRPMEEVQEVRRRVLLAFPDAGKEMLPDCSRFAKWFAEREKGRGRKRPPSPD